MLRDGEPLRILAGHALPETADRAKVAVGTVRIDPDGTARIATGTGWLRPTRLQRPGARPLDVADFQRGRGLREGERLASAAGGSEAPAAGPDADLG